MSKEKQIEEMAKVFCPDYDTVNCNIGCRAYGKCSIGLDAYTLYNAGYRKSSEGEWEKRTFIIFDSEKVGFRCSECNTTWDTKTNFCPNCGAKMKGA